MENVLIAFTAALILAMVSLSGCGSEPITQVHSDLTGEPCITSTLETGEITWCGKPDTGWCCVAVQ